MTQLAGLSFRSLLFAPAVRPDLVAKMQSTGADAIVIDLEDGTPPGKKAAAGANLEALVASAAGPAAVFARINAVQSHWFGADISSIASLAPLGEINLVVPKVETIEQVQKLADTLSAVLPRQEDLRVIVGLETVRSVVNAQSLLAVPLVAAAYFGAEDYVADLGGRRTDSNHEVATARSLVAMAGRLAGVPLFDQVVAKYEDAGRFALEASQARDLGYLGKLCVHPSQVAIANELFAPTDSEIAAARSIVAAHRDGVEGGQAVVSLNGHMVDGPVVAQAERVLELAERYGSE